MLSINYLFKNHIYSLYMYKQDLALNNLQGLICHKIQPINYLHIPAVLIYLR